MGDILRISSLTDIFDTQARAALLGRLTCQKGLTLKVT